jgi:hypothetical protein
MSEHTIYVEGERATLKCPRPLTDEQVLEAERIVGKIKGKLCDLCYGKLTVDEVELVSTHGLLREPTPVGMTVQWGCRGCGAVYLAAFPSSAMEGEDAP